MIIICMKYIIYNVFGSTVPVKNFRTVSSKTGLSNTQPVLLTGRLRVES